MASYDRCPADLRCLLAAALHSVEPMKPIEDAYYNLRDFLPHGMVVQNLAAHLAQAEAVGIVNMARRYREKCGQPYPHTEAQATICRPDEKRY